MQPEEQLEGGVEPEKYLVFSLAGELYAASMMSVREVMKITTIKPVPYMVSHFKGVINLRGRIVSVIDLRLRLRLPAQEQGLILVVDRDGEAIGAIVDDVVSVATIAANEIDHSSTLETSAPVDFLIGMARHEDRLVHVIDIAGTLSKDDFATIKRHKGAVA